MIPDELNARALATSCITNGMDGWMAYKHGHSIRGMDSQCSCCFTQEPSQPAYRLLHCRLHAGAFCTAGFMQEPLQPALLLLLLQASSRSLDSQRCCSCCCRLQALLLQASILRRPGRTLALPATAVQASAISEAGVLPAAAVAALMHGPS